MDNPPSENQDAAIPGLEINSTGNPVQQTAAAAQPAAANTPRAGDLTLKEIMEQINQGLLVIRAKWYWGVLAAMVLGGLIGYALLSKPVESIAETTMLAENSLDRVLGVKNDLPDDTQSRENSMRNHLSVMTSRSFRTRLVASFSQSEIDEIAAAYQKPGMTADKNWLNDFLNSKISVERERGREFFTIRVSHLRPDMAIKLADKFTVQYILQVQDEYRRINKEGLEILQKQADLLRSSIAQDSEDRLEFRKKNRIISRSDNQGILSERLRRLDASLTDTRILRIQLENRYNRAKADRASAEYPWDNSYLATFADNGPLRQQLSQLLAQRGVLASKYGPNHPKMRDIEASIRSNQENIKRNFDIAVSDLETQYQTIRQAETQLQQEFDSAFDSSIEIEKLATRYESIGNDSGAMKESLDKINKQISNAGISSTLTASIMRVVDPASLVRPRISKKVIYLAVTLFVSFVAFVSAPLAANLLDERIKATVDLEELLGRPLLGAIPALKARAEDRAHIVRDRTDALITEAFVGVAGGLDLVAGSAYPKCILVTSTLPGEGKSMIVSNLAASYSQLGKKVVVIDLDLRRPSQHGLHNVSDAAGFLAWARDGYKLENVLDASSKLSPILLPDGTHLVTAGGNDPHPSNYLITKQLGQLIQIMMNAYDVVIIDTPPAGLFQDSLVLSRFAHQRILVTRVGKAPVAQVKKVIGDFERASYPFVGTVINGFDPTSSHKKLAYGYNAQGYGYKAGDPSGGH